MKEEETHPVSAQPLEAKSPYAEHNETLPMVYDDDEAEPELHARTWMAIAAMCVLNFAQVLVLFGPTSVLSVIGRSLNAPSEQTWVPNALSLVAAVLGPLLSSASDVFQARKPILLGNCVLAFIGSAIAPGSQSMGRLIAASVVIGLGYASVPLGYSVPSEVLPRKWRPMAQAAINISASLASIAGPLIISAMVRSDPVNGWRNYYWIVMALWGVSAIGLYFGYRPPKRRTEYDELSIWNKIGVLDLPGFALLTVGLSLYLTGMNLGGGLYKWTDVRTLATLIIGIVTCIAFCLYEWKGTRTGIVHHDLFSLGRRYSRTFAVCCALFAVEAALIFAFVVFYPVLTSTIYESDPFLSVARGLPFWVAGLLTTPIWGWASSHFRTIRAPMFVGFVIYTAGTVGFATLQPHHSFNALAFAAVSGIGFGAPLVLIISAVQLSTPHALIATATAVAVACRAIFATVFTAIYSAVLNNRLPGQISNQVPPALAMAGLAPENIPAFIQALTAQDPSAFQNIPGITPTIIEAGVAAFKQAFADSIRPIFIIASVFAAVATVSVLLIDDMKESMNYRVEAPVENLHAKHSPGHDGAGKA